ncbi:uncharacterized protein C8Q71DRAFT_687641, partial [Rhodofomes roseus]
MWTKRYLNLTDDHPRWAYIVDVLFSKNVSKDAGAIKKNAQINTFLQAWNPSTGRGSCLPGYLRQMLKTAKRYNVSFEAVKLDEQMKKALPIWYHLGATKLLRRLNNTTTSNCLRDVHGVTYVAELFKLIQRPCYIKAVETSNDFVPHCDCNDCEKDMEQGCRHPLRCCKAASALLRQVNRKWNPTMDTSPDGLSLTKRRKETNANALQDKGDVLFDPSLTTRGPVEEAFRVFVDPEVHEKPPAIRERRGRIVPKEGVTAYVSG